MHWILFYLRNINLSFFYIWPVLCWNLFLLFQTFSMSTKITMSFLFWSSFMLFNLYLLIFVYQIRLSLSLCNKVNLIMENGCYWIACVCTCACASIYIVWVHVYQSVQLENREKLTRMCYFFPPHGFKSSSLATNTFTYSAILLSFEQTWICF